MCLWLLYLVGALSYRYPQDDSKLRMTLRMTLEQVFLQLQAEYTLVFIFLWVIMG